jgi:hypothetical protein
MEGSRHLLASLRTATAEEQPELTAAFWLGLWRVEEN